MILDKQIESRNLTIESFALHRRYSREHKRPWNTWWVNKSTSLKTSPIVILERKLNNYALNPRVILEIYDLKGLGFMGKGKRSQSGESTILEL